MNPFFIALLNPLFHAIANHTDKYIISKYIKGVGVGALVLISSFFSAIVLPFVYIVNPDVLTSVPFYQGLVLALNGAFLMLGIICYFYALAEDETSLVAPFFQLIPVFGFIIGYFALGETLLGNQIAGSILIILGGIFLSLKFGEGKIKLKTKLIVLMLGSSLLYAINAVIFKSIAIHQGFLDSLFWDMLGKFALGVILFLLVIPYRQAFIKVVKTNRALIIFWLLVTEFLTLVGEIALIFAVLYAPVALIQSIGGLQPLFVLILGIIITVFFPKFGQESLNKSVLLQKSIGVAVITAGVYFLSI